MSIRCAAVLFVAMLIVPGLVLAQPSPEPRATFLVVKEFSDANPAEVEVRISCNTGLPLEQTVDVSMGNPVEFVVVDFDSGELDCFVAEVVPAGYSVTYLAVALGLQGNAESDNTDPDRGCRFTEIPHSGQFQCEVSNSLDDVPVTVHKQWVYENSDGNEIDDRFAVSLTCDDVSFGGGFGSGNATFTFFVLPHYLGSTCTVTETVFDSAVESDGSDCAVIEIGLGQGAECTIVNTVFFEGIPTLGRYGLAALAVLMLGIGLAAFRRFA